MSIPPDNSLLDHLLERLTLERDRVLAQSTHQQLRTALEGRIRSLEGRFKAEDLMTLMKAGVVAELTGLQAELEALPERPAEVDASPWLLELSGGPVALEHLEQVLERLTGPTLERAEFTPPQRPSRESLTAESEAPGGRFSDDASPEAPEGSVSPEIPASSQTEAVLEATLGQVEQDGIEEAASALETSPILPAVESESAADELERLERFVRDGGYPRHLSLLAVWLGRSENHTRTLLLGRGISNVGMEYYGLRAVDYALSWPELELVEQLLTETQTLPIALLMRQAGLHGLSGERMVGIMMAQAELYRFEQRQGGLHFTLRHAPLTLYARWKEQPHARHAPLEALEAGVRDALNQGRVEEVRHVFARLAGSSARRATLLERLTGVLDPALLENAGATQTSALSEAVASESPTASEIEIPERPAGNGSEFPASPALHEQEFSSAHGGAHSSDPAREAAFNDLALLLDPRYYPLLERIKAAGLPCPDDCHKDVFYKGQTTHAQAILVWTGPGLEVMLSDFEMQTHGIWVIPPNHPQMLEQLEVALRGLKVWG